MEEQVRARKPTTTLVLAAGRGSRIGGPKALLLVQGRPLALVHADARLAAESERVVIVTRADVADTLRDHAPGARVELIASEEADELGPAGSIRAAVRAGALDVAGAVLVTPVDVRPVGADAASALLGALGGALAARFRHGHPVACRASVLVDAYRDGARPLRDVLAGLGAACAVLAAPSDERAEDDIDDRASFAAAFGSPPAFAARRNR